MDSLNPHMIHVGIIQGAKHIRMHKTLHFWTYEVITERTYDPIKKGKFVKNRILTIFKGICDGCFGQHLLTKCCPKCHGWKV